MRVRMIARYVLVVLLVLAVVLLFVPLCIQMMVAPHIYASAASAPPTTYAIVLGASVVRGQPSPILAQRANEAVELFEAGNVKKILVSGARVPYHDEVGTVRAYLRAAGIPDSAIVLDPSGVDTYTSMYRARALFHIDSATIVTQNFHMPRALFLARMLGMNAIGVVAPGESTPAAYGREILATWKALYDLLAHRVPLLDRAVS